MRKRAAAKPPIACPHPERPRHRRHACRQCYSLFHHNKHRETRLARQRARRKERYAHEPEYRERLKANSRRHEATKTREDRRREHLRSYGLTEESHAALLAAQDGRCAICRQPETRRNKYGLLPLAIDHCHTTGAVRGLLCLLCNTALGKFQDSPALMRAAIEYLEKETK